MEICIAGKNKIATDGLELAIAELGKENVIVCPNMGDDGISRWQPSLRRFAKELNVEIVKLEELYEKEDLIFISLEFDRIVCPGRFKTKKLFNVHFSKLPAYKGMYTSAWPILNGEKCSGVTLHKIDEGIDTGDIIDQVELELGEEETARSLYFSYMESAKIVLNRNLRALIEDKYTSTPQPAAGASYYSKSSIDYSHLTIDLKNTAEFVCRQARAFCFREFQLPQINSFPLDKGQILGSKSRGSVGKVIPDGPDAIIVSTIDFHVKFKRNKSWDFFHLVEESDAIGIANYSFEQDLINSTDANGWTPLIIAAYNGKSAICQALIDSGAEVNKPNQNGTTPLMYAKEYGVRTGDFSVCKLLLDCGADLSTSDRFGKTLMDYIQKGNEMAAINFFGDLNNA